MSDETGSGPTAGPPRLPLRWALLGGALWAGVVTLGALDALDGTGPLAALAVAAAIHASATGFGALLTHRVLGTGGSPAERWVFGWALGFGVLGLLMFALAHVGAFRPAAVLVVVSAGWVCLAFAWRASPPPALRAFASPSPWTVAALVVAAGVVLASHVPPTFPDAATYHVGVLQQYALWGEGVLTEHNYHSAMPLLCELASSPALVWLDPSAMNVTHAMTMVGLVLATGVCARTWLGSSASGPAMCIAVTLPVTHFATAATKSDLFFAVGGLGTLHFLGRFLVDDVDDDVAHDVDDQGSRAPSPDGSAWMLGAFGGLMCATKYTGLLWAGLAALFAVAAGRARGRLDARAALGALAFAVAFGAPTYVRNWIALGNPVFPFASSVFGGPESAALVVQALEADGLPKVRSFAELLEALRLPWDLSVVAREPTMNNLAGAVPLLLAPALVFARRLAPVVRLWLWLLLCSLPLWLWSVSLLRHHALLWAALPLLCAAALVEIRHAWPRLLRGATVAVAVLCATNLAYTVRADNLLTSGALTHALSVDDDDVWLAEVLPPYEAYRWLRDHTREDAVVFIVSDYRIAHLERRALISGAYSEPRIEPLIRASTSGAELLEKVRATGAGWMTFQPDMIERWQKRGWMQLGPPEGARVQEMLNLLGAPVFEANGVAVFSLAPAP